MHLLMNDLVHKVRRLFREVDEDGNGKVFLLTARFLFIYFMQRQCFVYFFATASFCYYFFCNNKVDFEEFLRLVRQRSENLDEEVFKHLCL